jgi:hypothetical protein
LARPECVIATISVDEVISDLEGQPDRVSVLS